MSGAEETYRAVHAIGPGKLELAQKPLVNPPPGHVRIRVEACGVCHTDAATVEGLLPIVWPRVPGHEVVGIIDTLGAGVEGWAVGQRIGVGFLGGSCGRCDQCRGGDLVNCRNQENTGVQHDGGYAEVLIAKASGLMSIPDELSAVAAAPLLCAGLTTFSALRNAGGRPGELVAILGIGGLGHLAVQYARHMGFEVVAIGRGAGKEQLARKLGAHHFIDSATGDPAGELQKLGGAALVIATASGGKSISQLMKGLRPRGRIVALGASPDPIETSAVDLLRGNLSIEGALTGDPSTGDATLKFSVLTGIQAIVETMPLEKVPEAYAKMMSGDARFRMVLTMKSVA